MSISRNGKSLATSGADFSTKSWDLDKNKLIESSDSNKDIILALAHSPDGRILVGAGVVDGVPDSPGVIRVWGARDMKALARWNAHEKGIAALAMTPDGHSVISGGHDGVKIWETGTWQLSGTIRTGSRVTALAVSPDGNSVAIGLWNGEVVFQSISKAARMINLKSELLKTSVAFWAHDLPITSLAFHFEGKMFASGSLDGNAKIWTNIPRFD